jgi:hypothetical protein
VDPFTNPDPEDDQERSLGANKSNHYKVVLSQVINGF